jgi:hypothetical protein
LPLGQAICLRFSTRQIRVVMLLPDPTPFPRTGKAHMHLRSSIAGISYRAGAPARHKQGGVDLSANSSMLRRHCGRAPGPWLDRARQRRRRTRRSGPNGRLFSRRNSPVLLSLSLSSFGFISSTSRMLIFSRFFASTDDTTTRRHCAVSSTQP